jgi:hypothetical protein
MEARQTNAALRRIEEAKALAQRRRRLLRGSDDEEDNQSAEKEDQSTSVQPVEPHTVSATEVANQQMDTTVELREPSEGIRADLTSSESADASEAATALQPEQVATLTSGTESTEPLATNPGTSCYNSSIAMFSTLTGLCYRCSGSNSAQETRKGRR